MSEFKWGWERQVKFSGECKIQAGLWAGYGGSTSSEGGSRSSSLHCEAMLAKLDVWLEWAGDLYGDNKLHAYIQTPFGNNEDVFSFPVYSSGLPEYSGGGDPFNLEWTGSWSVSCTAELWAEVELLGDNNADGFPTYGQNGGYPDSIKGRSIRFFERMKPGHDYTVSLTLTDGTNTIAALVTYTVGVMESINVSYGTYTRVQCECASGNADEGSVVGQWTLDFNDEPLGIPDFTCVGEGEDVTDAYLNPATSTGDANLTHGILLTGTGQYGPYGSGFAELTIHPPIGFDLDVRLRDWDSPYSRAIQAYVWQDKMRFNPLSGLFEPSTTQIAVSTGQSASAVDQRYWLGKVQHQWYNPYNGGTPYKVCSDGVYELLPVAGWLDGSTLASTNEDSRDVRMLWRGRPWRAGILSQDSAVSVRGSSTITTATNLTPTERIWEGYRYLRVIGSSSGGDNHALKIEIKNRQGALKTWNRTFGADGASQTMYLDLCAPEDPGVTIDRRDSRYPLKDPFGSPADDDPDETTMAAEDRGRLSGIYRCDTITVTPSGGNVALTSAHLLRRDDSSVSILPGFDNWEVLGWSSPTDHTYLHPFGILESDFRRSDWADMAHVVPDTSDPPYYVWYSVTDMLDWFDGVPGWHVTTRPVTWLDDYHQNSLEAAHLGGSGALHVAGEWVYSILLTVNSGGRDLNACGLYDVIDCSVPGCGDLWEAAGFPAGGASKRVPLRTAKILRAREQGLVFDESSLPIAGSVVTCTDVVSSAAAGAAASASDGRYATIPTYRGNRNVRTANGSQHSDEQWANRWARRTSFIGQRPEGGGVYCFERRTGWAYALIWDSTKLAIRRFFAGAQSEFVVLEGNITSASGVWEADQRQARVFYTLDGDANLYELVSKGNESTWSSPVAISTASRSAVAYEPKTGITVLIAYDDGSWTSWSRSAAVDWTEGGTLATMDPGDGGLCLEEGPRRQFRAVLTDGSTHRTFTSIDHGKTWQEESWS